MSVTQVTTSGIVNSAVTTAKIADSAVTTSNINFETALVPVGGIIMWSGTIAAAQALTGWKLCDGTNGTPDLRNRFIVGAHSGSGNGTTATSGPGFNVSTGALNSNYTPGNTGGSSSVTLTTNQIPSHTHGLSMISPDTSGPSTSVRYSSGYSNDRLSTDPTGGGQAHENRPPYYALAFIMRVS